MKPIKEIFTMLIDELSSHINNVNLSNKTGYYNELLGDTSFILAGLLESLLQNNFNNWNSNRWIDDSLITNAEIKNKKLLINGIIIWGVKDTTQQWTDPFSFKIDWPINNVHIKNLIIKVGDFDHPAITYEEFGSNRNHWRKTKRNWQYIFKSNEIG